MLDVTATGLRAGIEAAGGGVTGTGWDWWLRVLQGSGGGKRDAIPLPITQWPLRVPRGDMVGQPG